MDWDGVVYLNTSDRQAQTSFSGLPLSTAPFVQVPLISDNVTGQVYIYKMKNICFVSVALLAAYSHASPVSGSPEAGSTTSDKYPPSASTCSSDFVRSSSDVSV